MAVSMPKVSAKEYELMDKVEELEELVKELKLQNDELIS
jgi:hypothetical protein